MKRFFALSRTASTMCAVLGCLFLLLLIAGILFGALIYPFEAPFPYAIGLLLGCILSMLKVILLEKSLNRSLNMEGTQAKNYSSLQAILRYALTILVLLGVVIFPEVIGLFGVVLGILALQIAAYITGFIINKHKQAG